MARLQILVAAVAVPNRTSPLPKHSAGCWRRRIAVPSDAAQDERSRS